jgi:thiol:disulfide interchange protein DsbC
MFKLSVIRAQFLLALSISFSIFHIQAFAITADEMKLRLSQTYPEVKISSVKTTQLPNIFEIVVDKKTVMYTEETGQFFFPTIVDMKTKRNWGQERTQELSAIDWSELPLKNSIKIVKGNGKRKMAVFSDPDCPFCKRLEETLSSIDNVTIQLFPFPIASLHPNAYRKSVSIWCSKDPAKTWVNVVKNGETPEDKNCSNPIDSNVDLARKLDINGTPAIIFADGFVIPGAAPIEQIEERLNKVMVK